MEEGKVENTQHQKGIPDDVPQFRGILVIIAELIQQIYRNEKFLKSFKVAAAFLATVLSVLTVLAFILFAVPFIQEHIHVPGTRISNDPELAKDPLYRKEISLIDRDLRRLDRKYSSYTSGQSYIVINTTENRFFLYRNKKLMREGFCSSGSYTMLKTAEGDRKWIFKTPKGKYRIQWKTTNPVWRKPDWAFIEEGLPVPSLYDHSRYEYGVLGDYALAIGDGYLIHGTIYKRFLGMPVTHGCIRLNDEDLKVIFNTLSIGSKVYIF
jgi:lipoprotein-anchoring transpeptidase ErfK/SrfK